MSNRRKASETNTGMLKGRNGGQVTEGRGKIIQDYLVGKWWTTDKRYWVAWGSNS